MYVSTFRTNIGYKKINEPFCWETLAAAFWHWHNGFGRMDGGNDRLALALWHGSRSIQGSPPPSHQVRMLPWLQAAKTETAQEYHLRDTAPGRRTLLPSWSTVPLKLDFPFYCRCGCSAQSPCLLSSISGGFLALWAQPSLFSLPKSFYKYYHSKKKV